MNRALLVAACAGASLGWSGVVLSERAIQDAGPENWLRELPDVPLRQAELMGAPLAAGSGYRLDSHAQLWSPQPASFVSVEATVPRDRSIELKLFDERQDAGVSLWISRVGDGFTGKRPRHRA